MNDLNSSLLLWPTHTQGAMLFSSTQNSNSDLVTQSMGLAPRKVYLGLHCMLIVLNFNKVKVGKVWELQIGESTLYLHQCANSAFYFVVYKIGLKIYFCPLMAWKRSSCASDKCFKDVRFSNIIVKYYSQGLWEVPFEIQHQLACKHALQRADACSNLEILKQAKPLPQFLSVFRHKTTEACFTSVWTWLHFFKWNMFSPLLTLLSYRRKL